jgi:serine/threonine protein kinase
VIHGDIKPENILIFRHSARSLTAKVADFGFSTLLAGSGFINMPRTKPWQAPEWHHRGFRFPEAVAMDIYSYGMLCMWLLFYNYSDDPRSNLFRDLMDDNHPSGLALAERLIEKSSEVCEDEKYRLSQFFNWALAIEPKSRKTDLKQLLSLLIPGR